ncbi:hypothetical protein, partial [Evtepia gabavorous]|uniref:hypothetical protein n=3 Tax=Clostridia TaxID=186801 RepID=UPI003A8CF687
HKALKLHGQLLLVRFGASCFLLTLFNLQGAHRSYRAICILAQIQVVVKNFFLLFLQLFNLCLATALT